MQLKKTKIMNQKGIKIAYWISTGLFTAFMVLGTFRYFFAYETVAENMVSLGYPTYLIYPTGIAKILGLTAILTNLSSLLKNLAYAGFFYEMLLAIYSHIMVGDGQFLGATIALALVLGSYFFGRKLEDFARKEKA